MSTTLSGRFSQDVERLRDEVITWRRHLHQNPELSFQEKKTSQFVYETLQTFPGLVVTRPTPTSVMARLIGKQPGKTVALRADMDALPIQEESGVPFSSRNPGVMHACGHDGHTAMLLGVAKIFSKMTELITGELRFLFQHAEEKFPGGARDLVRAGVMEGVDAVVGAHLWTPLAVGKVGVAYGPMMAAPDLFRLTIQGKGGHAASPHQTVDAIAVGAQVVTNLQHLVSRRTDPLDSLVVSITEFHAGTEHNIIPDKAEIVGSVRTFDPSLREMAPEWIEQVIRGVTSAHGAQYELRFERGYHPVINDESVTRTVEEAVVEALGEEVIERVKPSMGGEDFSAYQQVTPGTFLFIGAGNPDKGAVYPHHHPRFTIDEDAMAIGMTVLVHGAWKLLHG
ncbi:N-acyl-L-amino acid amidohydrolase [Polycladomyces abyssicola]|uniref:N-acyl-L-amino acid amidohydrolase n=1 Tax=Polycladomyces abyssicola TaxID=1125966 RepID=A0A8D5UFG6_9BACL|nr:M20 family metallopeptidase [Polycladomyces abyssicola]BCU82511.1 N-acyl-L-amino acid amidohydrolase [Polycladomyces abyssicola]